MLSDKDIRIIKTPVIHLPIATSPTCTITSRDILTTNNTFVLLYNNRTVLEC